MRAEFFADLTGYVVDASAVVKTSWSPAQRTMAELENTSQAIGAVDKTHVEDTS